MSTPTSSPIPLPSPVLDGPVSLEKAIARRRSVREYSPEPLTPAQVGQLLWAAQGITGDEGHRAPPSAGATYPLELFAATVDGLFRYLPDGHALRMIRDADVRPDLAAATLGQAFIAEAPLIVAVTAVPARTAARYGGRSERYVAFEAGHAAQDVHLQAVAIGLASVPVGAFDDATVTRILGLGHGEVPLYLLPVGHPRMPAGG